MVALPIRRNRLTSFVGFHRQNRNGLVLVRVVIGWRVRVNARRRLVHHHAVVARCRYLNRFYGPLFGNGRGLRGAATVAAASAGPARRRRACCPGNWVRTTAGRANSGEGKQIGTS